MLVRSWLSLHERQEEEEREREKGGCRQTQDYTSYHVEVVTHKVVVCNPLKLKMKKVICSLQCQTFLLASTFYTPTTHILSEGEITFLSFYPAIKDVAQSCAEENFHIRTLASTILS